MLFAKNIFKFHAQVQMCHFVNFPLLNLAIRNIDNMYQGPPNPGFTPEKVQKGDFIKKILARIDFYVLFRFFMNHLKAITLNYKWVSGKNFSIQMVKSTLLNLLLTLYYCWYPHLHQMHAPFLLLHHYCSSNLDQTINDHGL